MQQQYERFFSEPSEFNIPNISKVKELQYFIAEYPNAQLMDSLFELQKNYSYYRAIAGDGNCYYRAIIFQYLKGADLSNKNKLFPSVDLFQCRGLPFEKRGGINSQGIMDYIFMNYLWPLENMNPRDREKQLEGQLNRSKNLDACLIAFFRVLNYTHLLRNRVEYESFSDAGIDRDLERILTYGQESEGIQLFTLSVVLEARVTIVVVHQQNYTQYDLNNQRYKHKFVVSYRPGHYDIPIPRDQVDTRYFSPVSAITPQPPSKNFGSPLLNRISQQRTSRLSGPHQRIQINQAKQIMFLRRVSQGNKSMPSDSGSSRTKTNLPETRSQFRQSIQRSNYKAERQDDREKETKSKPVEPQSKVSTKPNRTSLTSAKDRAKNKQQVFQVSVCVFFFFIAGATVFMI